jgi:hypothetical protein
MWKNTLPDRRTVEVHSILSPPYENETDYYIDIKVNTPPPLALNIYRESREVALRKYRCLLSEKPYHGLFRIE